MKRKLFCPFCRNEIALISHAYRCAKEFDVDQSKDVIRYVYLETRDSR